MENSIFNALIENKIFDRGNGIDNFSFEAKYKNYYINFFVDGDNICQVGDFGFINRKGNWEEETPSIEQYEKMQSIIDNEIQNWYEPQEKFIYEINDYYNYNGVRRENFY